MSVPVLVGGPAPEHGVIRPGVVMVTGAYDPEMSGAGLQCRSLVRALGDRVDCAILTTASGDAPGPAEVDGVPVHRVPVRIGDTRSEARAARALVTGFLRLSRGRAIVHFHGFSRKSVVLMLVARALGKRRIVKLTSVGHDDPPAIAAAGGVAAWAYRHADLYIGVSPRQRELCAGAGVVGNRFRLIPNGVDLERFRPPRAGEQEALRRTLALPEGRPIVLFVGFFSRDKRPELLFEAWRRTADAVPSTLVFVGATQSRYYEIDPSLARAVRADALALGDRVAFVERTEHIEQYYRAADVFVMPSSREGLPNALLEAMASGLACIATRLPGVTDTIVDEGVTGRLVASGEVEPLTLALADLLADPAARVRIGTSGRAAIASRYDINASADAHLDAYRALNRVGRKPGLR